MILFSDCVAEEGRHGIGDDSGLVVRPLPDQNFVLALPAAHRLAEKSPISVADLAGEPFLIAPRAIGPSIYDRVIALFRSQGISPRIIQEVTPMTTLTGLVAAGAGMGFVTEGIATVARPGVAFRPVVPEPPSLPMAAAWSEPALSISGVRFLDVVADLVGEENSSRRATSLIIGPLRDRASIAETGGRVGPPAGGCDCLQRHWSIRSQGRDIDRIIAALLRFIAGSICMRSVTFPP